MSNYSIKAQRLLRLYILSTVTILSYTGSMFAQTDVQNPVTTEEKKDYGPYQPLFTDGKEWLVVHGSDMIWDDPAYESDFSTHQLVKVAVDGEKIIDGIACKRLKVECDLLRDEDGSNDSCGFCLCVYDSPQFSPTRYIYAYEKDRKVYIYRDPGPYSIEAPDYAEESIYTGKSVHWGEPYFDVYMDLNIGKDDAIEDFGLITQEYYKDYGSLNCRTLESEIFGNPDKFFGRSIWIEGIGGNYLTNCYPYAGTERPTRYGRSYLALCTLNGEVLYDIRDQLDELGIYYGPTSGVNSIIEETPSEESIYYNLQGMRVNTPVKGNIYISTGRKIRY